MKFVSFMVGAMVLAAETAHAAPAHDTASQLQEADAQLARSDIAAAQATLTRVAVELAAATLPGADARLVNGAIAQPTESGDAYQSGWTKGFAEARAGKYNQHRTTDAYARGYEAGFAAGSSQD